MIFPFVVAEILSIPRIKHQPAVLQNESHPHLHEKDLRDYCRINKVVFQVIWILLSSGHIVKCKIEKLVI